MTEPLYRIGEAARLLELETYVLRFWETEFPQLQPLRTPKGQRLYSTEHVALLQRVKHLLYEEGMTIEGARKVLERSEDDVGEPVSSEKPTTGENRTQGRDSPPPSQNPADRRLLLELRADLAALRDTLHELDTDAPHYP